MPLMDALNTKRTWRYRLGSILAGNNRRTADVIAGADFAIAKGALTALNTSTFGTFDNAQFDNSVAITSGAAILTSANNPWTSAVVGQSIDVAGAGAAGATLRTTVAAYTSAGQITLTDNASTTVAPSSSSAAGLAIWGDLAVATFDPTPAYDSSGNQLDSGQLRETQKIITNITYVGAAGDAGYSNCTGAECAVGGVFYSVTADDDVIVFDGVALSTNVRVFMPESLTIQDGREITLVKMGGDGAHYLEPYNVVGSLQSAIGPANAIGAFTAPNLVVTYKFSLTKATWYIVRLCTPGNMFGFGDMERSLTAHAGGGVNSATALSKGKKVHRIDTCATAGDSVVLPAITDDLDSSNVAACKVGEVHVIANMGAAACQVFGGLYTGANTRDKVNGIAGATGISIPAGTVAYFVAEHDSTGASGDFSDWLAVLIPAAFNPAAPGAIGGTTPARVSATDFVGAVVNTAIAYQVLTTGDLILADVSGAGFTVTLEAAPAQGRTVTVKHVGGVDNTLTIGRNGKNIEGAAANITTAVPGEAITLQYDATYGWAIK